MQAGLYYFYILLLCTAIVALRHAIAIAIPRSFSPPLIERINRATHARFPELRVDFVVPFAHPSRQRLARLHARWVSVNVRA